MSMNLSKLLLAFSASENLRISMLAVKQVVTIHEIRGLLGGQLVGPTPE